MRKNKEETISIRGNNIKSRMKSLNFSKRKIKQRIKQLTAALFVILTLAITYLPGMPSWNDIYAVVGLKSQTIDESELEDLTVTFIDVGQGDSILIYTEDTSILIDTGPEENGQNIKDILDKFAIDELDYVIITHTHSDHIGSLDELEKLIPIDNEIIPSDNSKFANMTLTFDVKENQENAKNEDKITLEFLAPIYVNEDLNNMSLVIKLTYRDMSFLFTGDAEEEEEATMLKSYDSATLHADVLKVGHHGSSSSSSEAFIQAVSPTYAVISVGEGNDYGHPHWETLQTLANYDCEVYRTDEDGTIVFTTDGETIDVFSLK